MDTWRDIREDRDLNHPSPTCLLVDEHKAIPSPYLSSLAPRRPDAALHSQHLHPTHWQDHAETIPFSSPSAQARSLTMSSCSTVAVSSPQTHTRSSQSPGPTHDIEYCGQNTSSRATEGSGNDSATGEKPKTQIFACPYLRRDAVRHKACLNLRLKRIRDVKQHLQRRHSPLFHCPRCFAHFPSQTRRDTHINSQMCTLRDPPTSSEDVVSQQAQKILKQPVSRKLSPEQQWHTIWETLFPGEPAPRNPCLGTVVDEGMGMIRQFWVRRGSGLVSKHLDLLQGRQVSEQQLDGLVMRLLDDACGQLEQEAPEPEEALPSRKTPAIPPKRLPEWNQGPCMHNAEVGSHTGGIDSEAPGMYGEMLGEGEFAGYAFEVDGMDVLQWSEAPFVDPLQLSPSAEIPFTIKGESGLR